MMHPDEESVDAEVLALFGSRQAVIVARCVQAMDVFTFWFMEHRQLARPTSISTCASQDREHRRKGEAYDSHRPQPCRHASGKGEHPSFLRREDPLVRDGLAR